MALTGLWKTWRSSTGERVQSFAIITTRANELCAELYDRMPGDPEPAELAGLVRSRLIQRT
jgi:hypothetical protein